MVWHTCRLRDRRREVWVLQELVHDRLVDRPSGPHIPVLIVFSLSIRDEPDCSIDEHVARARIKVIRLVETT